MYRKVLVALIAVMLMLSITARAAIADELSEKLNTDKIEDSLQGTASEIMDEESINGGTDSERVTKKLYELAKSKLGTIFREAVAGSALLVLVAVLCSVGSSFIKTDGLGEVDYISLVGIISVAALSFGGVKSFAGEAAQTAEEISDFSKMLLPAITAASAASGSAASFSAKYAVTTMFMSMMISVIKAIILPVVYGYMASSIASAAFGGEGLKGAASLMKWAAVNILTLTVLIFTVYITISGAVAGTADATATRLTKTVLSTTLPIIGGIISDAAQTVLVGAATLKNAIGIYGLFAVLSICIVPFLRLGVNYLIYKGASMVASSVASGPIGKVIGSIGTAIGILLGACGACGLMLFFCIISAIKAVGVI